MDQQGPSDSRQQQPNGFNLNQALSANNNIVTDSSELLDSSQEEIRGLSCQICYQPFSREGEQVPRNLQCGHTYCTSCLSRLVGQHCIGTVRCPTCKHETLINGYMDSATHLPKNFGVLEILSSAEEEAKKRNANNPTMPKRPPPKPPAANGSIASGSSSGSGSRNVQYGSTESIGRGSTSTYESFGRRCNVHEGEPMKVFCKTCSEIICIYCQVYGDHVNHCCELITQTAEAGRREVISMSENLGRSKENLLLARQVIIETISAVRHKEEKTIREVTHHFDTLRKRVHKRESQLKDMAKCKTSQKILSLEAQERTISDLIDRCELTQRICTRSLTEDDVSLVEEKDVLLHEMSALTDIASDCELAPVCIDNITCQLPRDAFDVIMIHGTIEESLMDQPSTSNSMPSALDAGFGDRAVHDVSAFNTGISHETELPNSRSERNLVESSSRQSRRVTRARTCERHSSQSSGSLATQVARSSIGYAVATSNDSHNRGFSMEDFRNTNDVTESVNGIQSNHDLNGSLSSADMEFVRSSLEEAIRLVQSTSDSSQFDIPGPSNDGPTSPLSAREAAAQAAIKRSQIAQQVVQDYINTFQPALLQMERTGLEENAQMRDNLSNIQSAMQDIQSAVASARVTLEESMHGNNAQMSAAVHSNSPANTSSTTQHASPDSASYETTHASRNRAATTAVDNADDGIYEQVSDGECDPSEVFTLGNRGEISGTRNDRGSTSFYDLSGPGDAHPRVENDTSHVYHVYDASNPQFNQCIPLSASYAMPANYNSDSSDDERHPLPSPRDIYDGPYYSCNCDDESVSCSCSECNSDDDDDDDDEPDQIFMPSANGRRPSFPSKQRSRGGRSQDQFFSGVPNHLEFTAADHQPNRQYNHAQYMNRGLSQSKRAPQSYPPEFTTTPNADSQLSHGRNQSDEVGTMTKILNRMNLMKSKKNNSKRKKHHHKSQAQQRMADPNIQQQQNMNIESPDGQPSCSSFLNTASRPQPPRQNPFVLANSGTSGSVKPKVSTAQKQRTSSRKSSTTSKPSPPTGQKPISKTSNNVYMAAESVESLTNTPPYISASESNYNLSQYSPANSWPRCSNVASSSCMSGEPALFICKYCQKKYCHICAVSAAGKKCPKKPGKSHSIVPLDDDQSENALASAADLNVAKNPESVSHKFTVKCTNCSCVKEFAVDTKVCSSCNASLQIDLNLYNPCPNCNLLNSKDAIACEVCSSDIISI